jgi:hypothetical protein
LPLPDCLKEQETPILRRGRYQSCDDCLKEQETPILRRGRYQSCDEAGNLNFPTGSSISPFSSSKLTSRGRPGGVEMVVGGMLREERGSEKERERGEGGTRDGWMDGPGL